MGADKNEGTKSSLRHPKVSHSDAGVADWMGCNAELLQKAIAVSGHKHCALRFGYTRDGGAYAVGVYAGADYFTDYIRPSESIDDYLTDLIGALEDYIPEEGLQGRSKRSK